MIGVIIFNLVSADFLDLDTVVYPADPVPVVAPVVVETVKNKKRKRDKSGPVTISNNVSPVQDPVVSTEIEPDDGQEPKNEEDDGVYSKEKEIEKLRTGGSMTQNIGEISRVKNIKSISFGRYEVETWYFSPYFYLILDILKNTPN